MDGLRVLPWLLLLCVGAVCASPESSNNSEKSPLTLWYKKPAASWEEALPIGNGRLGAMVFGGTDEEVIQINEDTFWAGSPYNNFNPKAQQALPEMRRLLDNGDASEAAELAKTDFASQKGNGMPYQSAGELTLRFPGHEKAQDYYRDLNLDTAVASTRYRVGDVIYQRQVFSSFDDQVIALQITASEPGALNFTAALTHPDGMQTRVDGKAASLRLTGTGRSHEGIEGRVRLADRVDILIDDGRVSEEGQSLSVEGASRATILIAAATNFVTYQDISGDAQARVDAFMKDARAQFDGASEAFARLRDVNSKRHQEQFRRVSFSLPAAEGAPKDYAAMTTRERIAGFADNYDNAFVPLYFQFGRYLLIASSQPGTQPANLQGIWNDKSVPAWDSKYTLNINAEMNYWPSDVTNLSELNEPLMSMIKELSVTGKETAEKMYGMDGFVVHHNTDIWRMTGGVDRDWAPWPMGAAWLLQHAWEKYLFSGDRHIVEEFYPILKSACDFYVDYLIPQKDTGWLIASPSISPENAPKARGKMVSPGVAMDGQLLFDLFSHTLVFSQILGEDEDRRSEWQGVIDQLPPPQIGRYYQIQEWLQDWDDPQDHHRHLSHLYALHPSNQISPWTTPELFKAARVTMEQRGDPSTGWSMNWKINLWARLLDGDRALRLMREQISPAYSDQPMDEHSGGTYPNMFDAHPPFQIDGNFGFTAGVAEMLAQSHDGAVHLLPALPQEWPDGEVTGLVMRGGFVVDMRWKQGRVVELSVMSRLGGNLRLRSYDPLPAAHGFKTRSAKGENSNAFYARPQVKSVQINTYKKIPGMVAPSVYEIDVATTAGERYQWRAAEVMQ